MRLFIIQHDCGPGAFFRSRRANAVAGVLCSLATLTPYTLWRRHHAVHYSIWNNLDERDPGSDIHSSVLTPWEYRVLPRWCRLGYRLIRHPLVAQLLVPPVVFLVLYRLPFDTPRSWTSERRAVWLTDAGLAAGAGAGVLVVTFGLWPVLLVQVPPIAVAAIVGAWPFSVQHRFEDARCLRAGE